MTETQLIQSIQDKVTPFTCESAWDIPEMVTYDNIMSKVDLIVEEEVFNGDEEINDCFNDFEEFTRSIVMDLL